VISTLRRRVAALELGQGDDDDGCPRCAGWPVIVDAAGNEHSAPCPACGSTGEGRRVIRRIVVVIPDNGRGDLYGGQL
jgi:hypothetical protein